MLTKDMLEARRRLPRDPETDSYSDAPADRPAATRTIRVTEEFEKTFGEFRRSFPQIGPTLREFLAHRCHGGIRNTFGGKDYMMSTNLRGYWHIHLFYGKAILIYLITEKHLDLLTIIDHLSFDSKAPARVRKLKTRLDRLSGEGLRDFAGNDAG